MIHGENIPQIVLRSWPFEIESSWMIQKCFYVELMLPPVIVRYFLVWCSFCMSPSNKYVACIWMLYMTKLVSLGVSRCHSLSMCPVWVRHWRDKRFTRQPVADRWSYSDTNWSSIIICIHSGFWTLLRPLNPFESKLLSLWLVIMHKFPGLFLSG